MITRSNLVLLGSLLAALAISGPADSQPSPPSGVRLPAPAGAAWQYFAFVDAIPGDATDRAHQGWIVADTFSFGGTQAGTFAYGGGGGAGKAAIQNLTFTHHVDVASPKLFGAMTTGVHLKEARFDAQPAGGAPEVRVRLTDVIVTSVQVDGAGSRARESVSLNFAKIVYEVGAQKAGWDLKGNVAF